MDQRTRSALRRRLGLLVALAAAAAALLAAEAGLRLAHPLLPRDLKVVWIRGVLMRGHRMHFAHKELIWALQPGVDLRYPGESLKWRLRHIAYPNDPATGYRADEPPRGPVDLLVLGDSFTYAFEVDQDSTWVERLRRKTGLSAVNLAVTSYGTSQEAEVYRLYGSSFRHKAVLQVVATNDPLDNVFFREINPDKDPRVVNLCWFIGAAQGGLICRSALWAMNRSVVAAIAIFQAQAFAKRRGADDPAMMRGTEMICRDAADVKRRSRVHGARYGVALIGFWQQEKLAPLKKRLDACLGELGVPVLQLDDARTARRSGRRFFGRFDWHWNDEGHEYVAAQTARFLEDLGWFRRRR